jgi:hypothetical protein
MDECGRQENGAGIDDDDEAENDKVIAKTSVSDDDKMGEELVLVEADHVERDEKQVLQSQHVSKRFAGGYALVRNWTTISFPALLQLCAILLRLIWNA